MEVEHSECKIVNSDLSCRDFLFLFCSVIGFFFGFFFFTQIALLVIVEGTVTLLGDKPGFKV